MLLEGNRIFVHTRSGKNYRLLGFGLKEDDLVVMAIYQSTLIDDQIFVRPVSEFFGLNSDGKERFVAIDMAEVEASKAKTGK
jgi:hypothetical protein